jgi:hypothetical protein
MAKEEEERKRREAAEKEARELAEKMRAEVLSLFSPLLSFSLALLGSTSTALSTCLPHENSTCTAGQDFRGGVQGTNGQARTGARGASQARA